MKKTGFLHDDRYTLHQTGGWHPECPDRIKAIADGVNESDIYSELAIISAVPANQRWIEAVHPVTYIMRFEEACFSGLKDFDHQDNPICMETYEVALLAVGGVLKMIDQVMEGTLKNGFCSVRPPGHHAEKDQAMGFCFFNNIAIAARYLQLNWDIKRVGIIDFDVHHGNGTQHIFEKDQSVYYYSIHQHPSFSYPGTGREFDYGLGQGNGFTLNSTILPGKGDDDYMEFIEKDLIPAFDEFKPEVILVSAGFDAHRADTMSDTNLTTEGYDWITTKIVELAARHSQGRIISVLEGGYNLKILPDLVVNHLKILAETT